MIESKMEKEFVMQTDFNEIYQLYARRLYLFIYDKCKNIELSEDVLQTTFLKAILNIESFREDSSIYVWLCSIALNTLYSELCRAENRNSSIEAMIEANIPIFIEENKEDPLSILIEKEDRDELYRYIKKLDDNKRKVVMMRLNGIAFKEIAFTLGKSEGWSKMNYKRAIEKLRQMIKKD